MFAALQTGAGSLHVARLRAIVKHTAAAAYGDVWAGWEQWETRPGT